MLTELEHSKALNKRAWSVLGRKIVPFVFALSLGFAYTKHCELHERARSRGFYNRSKLFGGANTPQY